MEDSTDEVTEERAESDIVVQDEVEVRVLLGRETDTVSIGRDVDAVWTPHICFFVFFFFFFFLGNFFILILSTFFFLMRET